MIKITFILDNVWVNTENTIEIMDIQRDITDKLIAWRESNPRLPLILQGARQIGKTWTVTRFGECHFKHCAVFNFERTPELEQIFLQTKDVHQILHELSYYSTAPIGNDDCLIFFDEIQECSAALNSLKYFAEDAPSIPIVAAGSLLGVALNRSRNGFPVGKVHFEQMYPLSFKEYLRAANSELFTQIDHLAGLKEPLPVAVFNHTAQYYLDYQICGGLPKATSAFLDKENIEMVEDILRDILRAYELDFSKYSAPKEIGRASCRERV